MNHRPTELPGDGAYATWLVEEWRPYFAANRTSTFSELQSGYPPPPHLSFEEYHHWVFEEIVPELARRGQVTEEKLIADFVRNEGRMTEFKL